VGDLKKMFNPETVALVGASDRENSIGRALLQNLLVSEGRKIFAVNPNRKTALRLECYSSVGDIGEHIDLAVIAVPAASVPGVVEECGKAGVEGAIIISAGFRESGEEGRRLEERVSDIRKKYGVRILGPNSLGAIMPNIGLNATFFRTNPQPGNVAFISQSGALGEAIVDWGISNNIGFSMFASLGSMMDVDYSDLIDLLQDDYFTKSITIYMERVGNARKFVSSSRAFACGKPIVILKPGRFPGNRGALISHTGADTGEDRAYDAAFKRAGLVRVKEVKDLFDTTRVLVSRNQPRGPKLAVAANSGSVGVIATDTLFELKGQPAAFSEETASSLAAILPAQSGKNNPVDILGDADLGRYTKIVSICLKDEGVDGVLVGYTPRAEVEPDELARAIVGMASGTAKPIIVVWMGGQYGDKGREILIENSIPVYETPEEAVRAYLYMYNYRRNVEFLNETPEELPLNRGGLKNYLKAIVRNALADGAFSLPVEEGMDFLRNYGIPVARTSVVRNVDQAVRAGGEIGYPVVLRVVTHGTSMAGNTMAGLASGDELKSAYNLLTQMARENRPGLSEPEMVVQKMLGKIDRMFTLKAMRDIDFGTVIYFGDHSPDGRADAGLSAALPPLNQILARGLLDDIGIDTLLQDLAEVREHAMRHLEEVLVCFSNLIADFPEIAAMEVAPLALSDGKACALNVKVLLERSAVTPASRYPHLVITPYPAQYIIPWSLKDGTEVTIRPVRAEDAPLAGEMIASLSEETMRVRFFVVPEVSHKVLMRFCNVDYDKEMAFVVELKGGERRRIIGGGRLIIDPDFTHGQFALLVHDDFHGKGLGEKLLDIMIGVAQEKGLQEIYGIVLSENAKMLRVCRKMGFRQTLLPDGITRVSLLLN